jgi:hypothetical protein
MTHMSEQSPPVVPAGWYAHPSMPNSQGYWDGQAWTDHVAPTAPTRTVTQPQVEESFGAISVLGYITAILLPFVGFIIGVVLLFKRPSSGIPVIILSIVAFFVWYSAFVDQSQPTYEYSGY